MARLISLLGFTTAALTATLSIRDTSCNPGPLTNNNRQCTIECRIDHSGGDYLAISVPDLQTCINACSSDSNCKSAQYATATSYCYLKNVVNSGSSNANVNGIVCQDSASSSSTTTTATTTISSAATSSCSSGPITINGRTGTVECNTDHPGGDYSAISVQTFAACENACAADANCLTAQYDSNRQYCYLKSVINSAQQQNNIWGIVFSGTASSTTPSATSSTISSTTPSTASSATSSTTSSATPSTTLQPTSPPSTTSSTSATTTTSVSPSYCSAGYVTVNGRPAVRQCGFDYPGGDYMNQYTSSMPPCENLCATDPNCVVAVYNFENSYCYLKNISYSPTWKGGVNAIKFNPTSTATPAPKCTNTAPDSPYLLNGGFERGTLDVTQPTAVYGGGPGSGPSVSGAFSVSVGTGANFEGCNSIYAYPTYPYSDTPRLVLGMRFYNLQPSTLYNLTFILGGISDANTNTAPYYGVYTGGKTIAQGSVCGWSNSTACPITGPNRVKGQLISAIFTPGSDYYGSYVYFLFGWTSSLYNEVVLDDVRINLASSTVIATTISSTTTTTSSITTSTTSPTTLSTSTTTTTSSCLATYTTISGRFGTVQCGIDRAGGDLASQYASSLQVCEAACAANPQCVTAQYTGGSTGGTCYLKSSANTPVHKAGVDGIVFYTTASSSSPPSTGTAPACTATAPPNPYLINGGLEYGWMDDNNSGGGTGSFNGQITNGIAFEGCHATYWVPTSDASQPREISSGPQYQGLQNGVTYNLTFIIGRTIPYTTSYKAPRFVVRADGYRAIASGAVCGYADTGPCPIVGTGGARGQLVTAKFTAQNARPFQLEDPTQTIFVDITYTDASNDQILMDDFRLNPA